MRQVLSQLTTIITNEQIIQTDLNEAIAQLTTVQSEVTTILNTVSRIRVDESCT